MAALRQPQPPKLYTMTFLNHPAFFPATKRGARTLSVAFALTAALLSAPLFAAPLSESSPAAATVASSPAEPAFRLVSSMRTLKPVT